MLAQLALQRKQFCSENYKCCTWNTLACNVNACAYRSRLHYECEPFALQLIGWVGMQLLGGSKRAPTPS
jgi:hypothetical protein